MHIKPLFTFIAIALLTGLNSASWADVAADLLPLQNRWAEINYQLSGREQEQAFSQLIEQVDELLEHNPESAPLWIWSGIIKSTYAGAKGGLGALSLAKDSRKDLEKAMSLDAAALNGSAYATLGTLYFSVPGWPVGFGDDDKAEELLLEALRIAPDGIDNNYFYAEFKRKHKDYAVAREYYQKAHNAAPRPGRELADTGRQADIAKALAAME